MTDLNVPLQLISSETGQYHFISQNTFYFSKIHKLLLNIFNSGKSQDHRQWDDDVSYSKFYPFIFHNVPNGDPLGDYEAFGLLLLKECCKGVWTI